MFKCSPTRNLIRSILLLSLPLHFTLETSSARANAIAPTFVAAQGYKTPEEINAENRSARKAESMMHSGKLQDAIFFLNGELAAMPRSAILHFELGNAHLRSREFTRAIECYQQAVRLKNPFPEACLNAAYACIDAGMELQAIPWFHKYLRECPNAANAKEVEAELLVAHAKAQMKEKRNFDAKQTLERALQIAPKSEIVLFSLARVRSELGDTQGAINAYEDLLQVNPRHSSALLNMAECYQTMGQLLKAVTWLKKYAAANPNAPDIGQVQNMIQALTEKSSEQRSDPQALDYCGAISEAGRFYRWPPNRLPIKVWVSTGEGVPGYKPEFRAGFFDALNSWMKAGQGRLQYVLVDSKEQADLTAEWTGDPYDVKPTGHNVEQGVCLLASVDRHKDCIDIDRADIRILTIDRQSQQPLSDEEMKKTCLHELGHSMGLQGHSTNNHDIMFFSMSNTNWPVLSKRDRATLFMIYQNYRPLVSVQQQ
ncbi:MAG TPA: tetratricopeptide repeat protein [Candidatus Melainabacteria bacterium]|nr:tetratricopeptide repeat protein [Candidatus Melainabacteria bacterium]